MGTVLNAFHDARGRKDRWPAEFSAEWIAKNKTLSKINWGSTLIIPSEVPNCRFLPILMSLALVQETVL